MGRMKKDGAFFNCYMKKDVYEALSAYADQTGIPKTIIVEKAIQKYLVAPVASTDSTESPVSDPVMSLLSSYQKGQYVYPSVLVRKLHISYDKAISILDRMDSLEKLKYGKCPRCLHGDISSAVPFHETLDDTCNCPVCDASFTTDHDQNIDIVYLVK